MTDAGSGREPESPDPRLEWDGTQFLPASQVSNNNIGATRLSASLPDPWLAVLAFVVGFLLFVAGISALLTLPGDMVGDTIAAAACAVGAGLMIWCPIELIRIRPLPQRMRDQSLEDRLSHTLRFTAAELALNRKGQLSIVQRLRLLGFDLGWWLTVLACFGVVAGYLALGRRGSAIFALLFAVLGLFALWQASSTLIDAVRGRVRTDLTSLQPIVQPRNLVTELLKNWADSTVYYAYQGKGGLQFWVSRAAYEALAPPGKQYRVYFAPLSKRLMSLELTGD